MKMITKVVLAAALVLLAAGVFTGAAAAAGPALPVGVLPAEAHTQADVVQGAEIHAASGADGVSAPILKTAREIVLKKKGEKGQRIPLIPFVPKQLPGTSLPVIKPVHHTVSPVITP